jgi:hypothetical protein
MICSFHVSLITYRIGLFGALVPKDNLQILEQPEQRRQSVSSRGRQSLPIKESESQRRRSEPAKLSKNKT